MEIPDNKLISKEIDLYQLDLQRLTIKLLGDQDDIYFVDSDNRLTILDSKNSNLKKFFIDKEKLRHIIPNFSKRKFNNYAFFYQYEESIYGFDKKKGKSKLILKEEGVRYSKILMYENRLYIFMKKFKNQSRIKIYDLRIKKRLIETAVPFPSRKIQRNFEVYCYMRFGFRTKNLISCLSFLKFVPVVMEIRGSDSIQIVRLNLEHRLRVPKVTLII